MGVCSGTWALLEDGVAAIAAAEGRFSHGRPSAAVPQVTASRSTRTSKVRRCGRNSRRRCRPNSGCGRDFRVALGSTSVSDDRACQVNNHRRLATTQPELAGLTHARTLTESTLAQQLHESGTQWSAVGIALACTSETAQRLANHYVTLADGRSSQRSTALVLMR